MFYTRAALALGLLSLPAMAHDCRWEPRHDVDHRRSEYYGRVEEGRRLPPPWARAARYETRRDDWRERRPEAGVIYVDPAPRLVIRPHLELWFGR